MPDPRRLKVQRFLLLVGEMESPTKGYLYGRELVKEFWDDADMLNQLSWFVVDNESVGFRDLGFAMETAERACELTEYKHAAILDTLALGLVPSRAGAAGGL